MVKCLIKYYAEKNNQNYHPGTEPQQNSRVATPISHPLRNTEKQAKPPEQERQILHEISII